MNPARAALTIVLLVAWSSAAPPRVGAAAPAAGDVQERARALLEDGSYQVELPLAGGGSARCDLDDPACVGRLEPLRRGTRSIEEPAPRGGGCEGGAAIAQALLWVILAAGLAALGVWIAHEIAGRRRTAAVAADAADPGPLGAAAGPDLGAVEALARAGRYAEAVHLLLVRVLAHIAPAAAADGPADALTSREVLARVGDAPTQAALGHLVDAVEVSLFGGRAVDRAAYDRCASCYRDLAATFTGAAP